MKNKPTSLWKLATVAASLLALSACGGTDDGGGTAPQQGAVQFVHGNYQAAAGRVQFSLDNVAAGDQAYGQASTYLPFAVGVHTVRTTAGAATGTSTVKLDPNTYYSYFAGPPAATGGLVGRFVTDNLTRPAAGQFRVRLVSLLVNAGTGIDLAQPLAAGGYQRIALDDDSFSSLAPVTTNLVVRDGSGQVLAQVGSGIGTGAGAKKYEDGRIYTVLAVGDAAATTADARPKVFVLTNL